MNKLHTTLKVNNFSYIYFYFGGTRWHSWPRHCAASRKVAVSISDVITGIFL